MANLIEIVKDLNAELNRKTIIDTSKVYTYSMEVDKTKNPTNEQLAAYFTNFIKNIYMTFPRMKGYRVEAALLPSQQTSNGIENIILQVRYKPSNGNYIIHQRRDVQERQPGLYGG